MNISTLQDYYTRDIRQQQEKLAKLKQNILTVSIIRLLLVLAGVLCIYLFWWNFWEILASLLVTILVFLFVVKKHDKLFRKKDYMETAINYNSNELKAIDYDFSPFDGAGERISSQHHYSLDLDVFGDKSLFQSINRCCTSYGKKLLAERFENPLTNGADITKNQEAVLELSKKPEVAKHFIVTGQLTSSKESDLMEMREFVQSPSLLSAHKIRKILIYAVPVCWILYFILLGTGILSVNTLALPVIAGLVLGECKRKKIDKLQLLVGKKEEIFSSYSELINIIVSEKVESELLQDIQNRFYKENQPAYEIIRKLSKLLGDLDARFNIFARVVLNTIFLWDIRKSLAIDSWKQKYASCLVQWIEALGEYDALTSLGMFACNHPDYVYPEIAEKYFVFEAKGLGHPLMHRDVCIKNDVIIPSNPYFMIVTGANMAGKSTYLRTLGVNYLLACTGAPVCAVSFKLYPASLVTSLRTSDSLSNNESYFFAELKRLQMIINELNEGKELFIILDEILKGTNSVDKQKGSLALVQQFLSLNTCGIIATHDLLLGSLADKFPETIKNFRFEADITGDELTFSYKLRPGIAENMNACFLMQKMGITV